MRAASPEVRLHLGYGWAMIGLFSALGLFLETLHGFKVGWYLDVDHEARRLMLQLAHAHGTLFGVLHLGFAFTIDRVRDFAGRDRIWASRLLRAGSVMMPGGFLAGGFFARGADPGLGVVLAPMGAVVLLAALALTWRGVRGG